MVLGNDNAAGSLESFLDGHNLARLIVSRLWIFSGLAYIVYHYFRYSRAYELLAYSIFGRALVGRELSVTGWWAV